MIPHNETPGFPGVSDVLKLSYFAVGSLIVASFAVMECVESGRSVAFFVCWG
jgi:hypothetical protein